MTDGGVRIREDEPKPAHGGSAATAMNGSTPTPDQMTTLAQEQASKLRVARRALSAIVGQGFVARFRAIA
jgi:hypothetical protein